MELLTQNSKIKKTSKEFNVRLFNFGIPAYKTATGKLTCPMADTCIKFCYARKGAYSWSNVKPAFEKRYEATKLDSFVDTMVHAIEKKKATYIRVHDSGDYYSRAYMLKWFKIAQKLPHVRFYSYTNMVELVKEFKSKGMIPQNYDFIFSDSGKQRDKIQPTDRHTKIFKSDSELAAAGYVDCSEYDLLATKWFNQNNKIGLIYH